MKWQRMHAIPWKGAICKFQSAFHNIAKALTLLMHTLHNADSVRVWAFLFTLTQNIYFPIILMNPVGRFCFECLGYRAVLHSIHICFLFFQELTLPRPFSYFSSNVFFFFHSLFFSLANVEFQLSFSNFSSLSFASAFSSNM